MKKSKLPPEASRAEKLRERAEDQTSLNHFFGPSAGKAARAVLLVLADMESDEPELIHESMEVKKRERV